MAADKYIDRNYLAIRAKSCNFQEYARVSDSLFIGSKCAVFDEHFLKTNNIKLIINVSNYDYKNNYNILTLAVKNIPDITYDTHEENAKYAQQLKDIMRDIAHNIHINTTIGNGVLVHCEMGMNRSALCIAIYLILYENKSAKEAILDIKMANITRDLDALTNPLFVKIIEDVDQSSKQKLNKNI